MSEDPHAPFALRALSEHSRHPLPGVSSPCPTDDREEESEERGAEASSRHEGMPFSAPEGPG